MTSGKRVQANLEELNNIATILMKYTRFHALIDSLEIILILKRSTYWSTNEHKTSQTMKFQKRAIVIAFLTTKTPHRNIYLNMGTMGHSSAFNDLSYA